MTVTTAGGAHLTLAELATQPACWRRAADLAGALPPGLLPTPGEPAILVGCGTSHYVGEAWAQLRTRAGLGRTRAAVPAELLAVEPDEAVLVLSRSGTTSDVVGLARELAATRPVTALVGDLDSPLAREHPRRVDLSFADERSVVQTRFATSALALLRASLGQDLGPAVAQAEEALRVPLPLPEASLVALRNVVFLGTGWTLALAHEAALKCREAAAAWTEAYALAEYQHGPIACAGPDTLVWALSPPAPDLVADVAATGAVLVVAERDPMAELVLVHRLAVELARLAGRDPDRPPHLHRSVRRG